MIDIKSYVNEQVKIISSKLDSFLKENMPSIVLDAMSYSVSNGGKRIRPILAVEFAKLCDGDIDTAINFGCAVEMIHTYSLIHDDLPCMDNDDMRRGKPSCHIAFGEDNALLAGDALLTEAFGLLASSKNVSDKNIIRAVSFLSSFAGINGMIGGQVLDLQFEKTKPTIDEILKMYSLKTCGLIKAACVLGCLSCNDYDENKIKAAIEYAENLGIAFQIQDDILDIEGDTVSLGKPVGSDEKNDKSTAVKYFGLEKSKELVKEYTDKAVSALNAFNNDTEILTQIAYMLVDRKN
ncbi:MAG: polyprenyl synthetase family protein [Clostridia bacterium]|nr:polyprenyl synthetase family protein [Clostridia bacterium]